MDRVSTQVVQVSEVKDNTLEDQVEVKDNTLEAQVSGVRVSTQEDMDTQGLITTLIPCTPITPTLRDGTEGPLSTSPDLIRPTSAGSSGTSLRVRPRRRVDLRLLLHPQPGLTIILFG